jgi:transposase
MKEHDARTLTPETRETLRAISVRLHEKELSNREIAEIVGIHEVTASRWLREYHRHGAASFREQSRGRAYGTHRTLTAAQESDLWNLMVTFTPDELNIPFALWTRKAVQELIRWRCHVAIPLRTVGEYLKRWGFTPQKPLKRAYEQDPATIERWLTEEYPSIVHQAHQEHGEIHWGDETGIQNTCHHGRGYAPCGETPVVEQPGQRIRLNMISTVTNQGKIRFMVYETTMTSVLLITFLSRLIKDAPHKVFLIVDNLKVHRSQAVQAWLSVHRQQIEVFYLPAYAPERNPDEYLNCDLKGGIQTTPAARTVGELKKKVISHMKRLQHLPQRVKTYFQDPMISYAAC